MLFGSFFSHGIAILLGSRLALFQNESILNLIRNFTYFLFILIGVFSLVPKKEKINSNNNSKSNIISKIINLKINYTFIIALSIIVGEIGDKTFLASLGFGIQYPNFKIMLVIGAILGMIFSDSIAIISGKFLSKYISEEKMQKLSGILFLLFGIVSFCIK